MIGTKERILSTEALAAMPLSISNKTTNQLTV